MATTSPWPPCLRGHHVPRMTMSPYPPCPHGHHVPKATRWPRGGCCCWAPWGSGCWRGGARTLGTPPGTLNASGTPRWDLASAFFFSTTLLTTVAWPSPPWGWGRGGAPEGQPPRHLYRVALAAYLLLGVTAALLLLAAFQQLLELHGVSAALRPPPDPPEEDGGLLDEGGQ
eukprot:XP_027303223.1 potassium channel subfamily K member 6-like [Anas platyrhynchos]